MSRKSRVMGFSHELMNHGLWLVAHGSWDMVCDCDYDYGCVRVFVCGHANET